MTADAYNPRDPLFLPKQRPEETLLFKALCARQDQLPRFDNMLIYVQPDVRLRDGRTMRPDFVITLRSTLAVEIDGSSHRGRYCTDRTKDQLLLDHNTPVLRIPVEDLENPVLVDDWIDRIVTRVHRFGWAA